MATVYDAVASGSARPNWKIVALWSLPEKAYWHQWDRLSMRDGVLCRRWEYVDKRPCNWQVVLPKTYRADFIHLSHTGMTGGHLGRSRTENQVQRRAYWYGWRKDVSAELRRCAPCAQYHRGSQPRQTNLNPFPSGEPLECLSLDITGKHPRSAKGNEYILTVMDGFTKWAEAFPIRNHTAPTVARVLVQQVFSRVGTPRRILTDRGAEFESDLFRELCRWFGIDKVRSTSYQPSTNGMLESFHRTLNTMLAKVVSDNQKDWDEHVPLVMSAYRASVHEATGYSPNFLMFGRENRLPLDLVLRPPVDDEQHYTSYDNFVETIQTRTRNVFDIAREHLGRAAERRKDAYDIGVKAAKFEAGQWVWCFYPRRRTGKSPKWTKYYGGPYLIVKVIAPCNCVIQKSKRSKPQVVHGDKLKLCYADTPVSWLSPAVDAEIAPETFPIVGGDLVLPDPYVRPSVQNERQRVPHDSEPDSDVSSDVVGDGETAVKQRIGSDGHVDVDQNSRPRVGVGLHSRDTDMGGSTPPDPANVRPPRTRRRPAYLNDYS